MSDLIASLAAKTLNLTEEKLAEIIYESDGTTIKADAVDQLVTLDAQRIKAIKESHKVELTKIHDEGYSKAKGETLAKFEKQLKDEFDLKTDATGMDLINEAIAKKANVAMGEDQIKLHPKYIELERKLNNDFVSKAEHDKILNEFNSFKTNYEKTKLTAVVSQDAIKIFRSLKPILPKEPSKAMAWEQDFVAKLSQYDYELQMDGNHIIKKSDGKRLETDNGYPVSFADFIKSEADKMFEFETQDPKGNSGNDNKASGGGGNIKLPATEAEYNAMIAGEADPAKRVALLKAYKELHK